MADGVTNVVSVRAQTSYAPTVVWKESTQGSRVADLHEIRSDVPRLRTTRRKMPFNPEWTPGTHHLSTGFSLRAGPGISYAVFSAHSCKVNLFCYS